MDTNKKILAFTLALLLIAILLIALISNLEKQRQQEKEKEVQSTQTNYIILKNSDYSNRIRDRSYYNYENYHNYYDYHYNSDFNREAEIIKDFSYYGKEVTREEFLGNYVVKYQVYVLNKGNTGNYFTVTFNFKTQEGFEYSEGITQYLRAGERKEFLYKDVQFERTEILSWNYKVERI